MLRILRRWRNCYKIRNYWTKPNRNETRPGRYAKESIRNLRNKKYGQWNKNPIDQTLILINWKWVTRDELEVSTEREKNKTHTKRN